MNWEAIGAIAAVLALVGGLGAWLLNRKRRAEGGTAITASGGSTQVVQSPQATTAPITVIGPANITQQVGAGVTKEELGALEGRIMKALEDIKKGFNSLLAVPADHRLLRLLQGFVLFTNLARAGVLARQDRYREAIVYLQDCLRSNLGPAEQSDIHLLLGDAYLKLGELIQAKDHFFKALAAAADVSDAREKQGSRAVALGNLGGLYMYSGELDKAEEHHLQALAIVRELGDRSGEASQLGNLGIIYRRRGQLARAEQHHRQAMAIYRGLGNRLEEGTALGALGNVYEANSQLQQARDCFQRALTIARKTKNRLGEGNMLSNLGVVYYKQNNLKKAESCQKSAIKIHHTLGNRMEEAIDKLNLGSLYGYISRLDKAEDCVRSALLLLEGAGNRPAEAQALRILGKVYLSKGELDRAEEHLQRALDLFEDIGAARQVEQTRSNLEAVRQARAKKK